MKILSAAQIRAADQYTVENEPIASIDLMERAAAAFTTRFINYFPPDNSIKIFCGTGNNGGDGLAIARQLKALHYHVEVYAVRYNEKTSPDFDINYQRLTRRNILKVGDIHSVKDMPEIKVGDILIDAIWGSGLSRPIEGFSVKVIEKINNSGAIVVAVDIPSGVFADQHTDGAAIHADLTITFQLPKLAFFFPENYRIVGEWEVVDIGLSQNFIEKQKTQYRLIDKEQAQSLLRPRSKFSHKGTFGHALIISGSYGKIGAAVLASTACLRSGAGLVTAYVPKCGYEILQTALPEAMVLTGDDDKIITLMNIEENFDAIGIGPGIGMNEETQSAVYVFLKKQENPLVIDADALNILAENKNWLKFIPRNSILTPHPKEFERLVGKAKTDFLRLKKQLEFSKEYKIFVILKGAHTCITTPDGKCYFNATGNAGMATAGSGDVLTGILTGLLAQGYEPVEAAVLGVYLHGLAGDFAEQELSMESITARDIIKYLDYAFEFTHY